MGTSKISFRYSSNPKNSAKAKEHAKALKKENSRKVYAYKDGKLFKIYNSYSEAGIDNKVKPGSISYYIKSGNILNGLILMKTEIDNTVINNCEDEYFSKSDLF